MQQGCTQPLQIGHALLDERQFIAQQCFNGLCRLGSAPQLLHIAANFAEAEPKLLRRTDEGDQLYGVIGIVPITPSAGP